MKRSPILIIGKKRKTGVRVNQRLQSLDTKHMRCQGQPIQHLTGRIQTHGAQPLKAHGPMAYPEF